MTRGRVDGASHWLSPSTHSAESSLSPLTQFLLTSHRRPAAVRTAPHIDRQRRIPRGVSRMSARISTRANGASDARPAAGSEAPRCAARRPSAAACRDSLSRCMPADAVLPGRRRHARVDRRIAAREHVAARPRTPRAGAPPSAIAPGSCRDGESACRPRIVPRPASEYPAALTTAAITSSVNHARRRAAQNTSSSRALSNAGLG